MGKLYDSKTIYAKEHKENIVENLKCVLTKEELLVYGKEVAQAQLNKVTTMDNLKSYQTKIKSDIAICDAKINSVSEKIRSGTEWRDVECTVTFDWDKGIKSIYRIDTGEFIRDDIIPEHERQEKLDL
jgi:hypothetical protein